MDVLLVHGLVRTAGSMLPLGRTLRRAGHDPHYFNYFASVESIPAIVGRLRRRLAPFRGGGGPYAAVGHSLGGVLLRQALVDAEGAPPRLLVLLASPSRSPRAARSAWRAFPFRWVTRDCGRLLATPDLFDELPEPDYPYLVIAGTRGLYGHLSPFGDEPNDGLVAVSEATLGDPDNVVTVPAAHTFIMNHPQVKAIIAASLARAEA